jgi:hypothetical protein
VATNAYLASIKANLKNGKLVWKEVVSAAMVFAKSSGNEDSATGVLDDASGDMEDERAFLLGESDSDSASD